MIIDNFSKEQIKEILDLYTINEYSIVKLSKIYNVGVYHITKLLQQNNIKIINRQNEIKFDYEFAKSLYLNGMSLSEIKRKHHIDRDTLSAMLKKDGVNVINKQNATKFNENVFDCIDTEEKAYWLGFIYADGYISSRDNAFELSLCLKDINHLYKFEKFVEYNNHVKHDSYRCRFYVTNKHLHETLNSYGCTPRKSLTLKFPDESIFKDKDLIRHFIRGYFDGDGCLLIVNYSKAINRNKSHMSVLGTEEFLNKIQEHLQLKKKNKLCCNNKESNEITKKLTFCGNAAKLISEYLYENSTIYLDRKFEKYKNIQEYCRLREESLKLQQANIDEG